MESPNPTPPIDPADGGAIIVPTATAAKPSRPWAWLLLLAGLAAAGYFAYVNRARLIGLLPGPRTNVVVDRPAARPVVLPVRPDSLLADTLARDSAGFADRFMAVSATTDTFTDREIASLNALLDSGRRRPTARATQDATGARGTAGSEGLFKVNTRYGKLASPADDAGSTAATTSATPGEASRGSTASSAERARRAAGLSGAGPTNAANPPRQGLFEQLLMPTPVAAPITESTPTPAEDFGVLARQPSLDYAQLTEIVANLGSELLSDPAGQAAGAARVLDVIAGGDGINAVLVADREGVIDYSSDRYYLRRSVAALVGGEAMGLERVRLVAGAEGRLVVIPLFHTYGRLGTAIIWLRPDLVER